MYVDNIPIGELEYTYWDDLFKMKISGKYNTVAKAFSSETEAIEAINSKKPLPVKPQYYTIYNIETLEVMKNIFEDWYTALTIQKNIENIHCARTKIVKTKTYKKNAKSMVAMENIKIKP